MTSHESGSLEMPNAGGTDLCIRSWFSDNPGVLCTPKVRDLDDDAPSSIPEWTFPSACRWSVSSSSTSSAEWILKDVWDPVLESLQPEDRQKLEHFFRDVLRIWNVPYVDIKTPLDSLTSLAQPRFMFNAPDAEMRASRLYTELKQLAQGADEPALSLIRSVIAALQIDCHRRERSLAHPINLAGTPSKTNRSSM